MNFSSDDNLEEIIATSNPINYRNILFSLDQGVVVLSDNRIIYANRTFCRMTGKNRGEMIGHHILEIAEVSDRSRLKTFLDTLLEHSRKEIIYSLTRESGTCNRVRMHAVSIQLQGVYATSKGICCSFCDISDLFDRIDSLSRRNRRLRSLLDDTESMIISFAPYDFKDILLVNKHVEAVLGCSVREILNGTVHLFDFVHPDFLDRVIAFYARFPDEAENEWIEYIIIGKDKQYKWVRDTGNTLYVEKGYGMPRRIDHTIVDITDQKERQAKLDTERAKLATIIQNSTDMIYRTTCEGNFLELNPAGRKMLGIAGEVPERKIQEFYVDPKKRSALLALISKGTPGQQVAKWKTSEGEIIDVAINAVAETDMTGQIVSYQGIVHNVTNALKMQKIESIKKISGGLSDKLNTPLMTIAMNIELMKEMISDKELDAQEFSSCLDLMHQAYEQILEPLQAVRTSYWDIKEVSDGTGGTIYEIQEDKDSR
jgi:PAS domain S-box-containing protein